MNKIFTAVKNIFLGGIMVTLLWALLITVSIILLLGATGTWLSSIVNSGDVWDDLDEYGKAVVEAFTSKQK